METESSLRNVVFWKINRMVFLDTDKTMDNVQKHNICTNSTELSTSWEAIITSGTQEILNILCNPRVSWSYSQDPSIGL
jgi:hypothetical protein